MADNETNTTGTMGGTPVGTVHISQGTVTAVSPDGSERALSSDSPVFADEQIVTGVDGMVSIIFNDAGQTRLDIGRESNVTLDEDVYLGAPPEDISDITADVEDIQQALASGEFDPTLELKATAAGGGIGGGAGGGRKFTTEDTDGEEGEVGAGLTTDGPGKGFGQDIPPGQAKKVEEPEGDRL